MADVTVTRIDDLEGFYHGLFLRARAAVGARSFGLAVVEMPPGFTDYPDHDHPGGQEEVYVVLRGSGELVVDDGEPIALDAETMLRVGPEARRVFRPGPDGLRMLAIGGVPGQPYEPPGYTELGAWDPLD